MQLLAYDIIHSLYAHYIYYIYRVKHLILSFHGDFSTTWYITWFFTWCKIPIEMKPLPKQSGQSRQVLTQKWSKLLVRKIIKKLHWKKDKIRWIFERFIQLGKHVKIAININITGAFGWILSTVISWWMWGGHGTYMMVGELRCIVLSNMRWERRWVIIVVCVWLY